MASVEHRLTLNYIGAEWRPAAAGDTVANINPADIDDCIGWFPDSRAADIDAAVAAADGAAAQWRAIGPIERAGYLRRAEQLLRERASDFADAISREQGKLTHEAAAEVERTLAIMDFIAGEARRLNGITTPAEQARTWSCTFRAPIGVVGLITPWNFPLAIPMWKVAPALVAGCTAVLKPSPITPLTSALLTDLFDTTGLPSGVLNLVQGGRPAGEALVGNPEVRGVSFTGSLAVGTAIHIAGAPRLLRMQLELGGKNAVIVCDDADLDRAAEAIVLGAFGQAGQRCSATSRVIVDVRVKDELVRRLTALASVMPVGPPTDPGSRIGPVVTEERLIACLSAIRSAQRAGAKLVYGGERISGGLPDGFYLEPTILQDVPRDAEIATEEIFGPVLAVLEAADFDDAIQVSNSVRYGMSGTVFTRNASRMFEALERLEDGMLHINRPGVGSYAHLPHTGVKSSQFGPPECSPEVWNFYTDLKSACIAY